MGRELCVHDGRAKDEPPGGECEAPEWHVWADVTPDEVAPRHHGPDLQAVSLVAIMLHKTWCPTAGDGCSYAPRDLQVALDAALTVRP